MIINYNLNVHVAAEATVDELMAENQNENLIIPGLFVVIITRLMIILSFQRQKLMLLILF